MNQKVLTVSSNIGTGFWTSICVAFCSLLGRKSKNYQKKQDKVLNDANRQLMEQFNAIGGIEISDYRVTWGGKLSVTISAIATVDEESLQTAKNSLRTCPKCGAPIDDSMLFCGECGEKLK